MLSDLVVLDLTQYLPGPYATQLLADFGARVIKVEAPRGDPTRHLPPHDEAGISVGFAALNANKDCLAIDLKHPDGVALLLRLVERADVLIEGFRPGVLERLGAGAAVCRATNPRLIYCSLSGYGADGPYADRAGHDLTYQAYAGALGLGTDLAGLPVAPGVQSADMLGSLAALVGVLIALQARQRTGEGRVVDASMLDALVSVQGMHLLNHAAGARAAARAMPLNGGFPCYDVYATADGKAIALGALEPKFWERFCDVVARPDWLGQQFDPALRPEVAALFRTRARDEWRVILENADCCVAPVLEVDEVLSDPHIDARGLAAPGQRPAPPVRFDPPGRRAGPDRVGRAPGADGQAVLQDLLGLDAAAVEALAQAGVIALP